MTNFIFSECSSKGGSKKGSCASGFGVCCIFTLNGDSNLDVSYNDTYIQNPDYPSTYGGTSSLTYTINKCSNGKLNYIKFLNINYIKFTGILV